MIQPIINQFTNNYLIIIILRLETVHNRKIKQRLRLQKLETIQSKNKTIYKITKIT